MSNPRTVLIQIAVERSSMLVRCEEYTNVAPTKAISCLIYGGRNFILTVLLQGLQFLFSIIPLMLNIRNLFADYRQ
jgi:hypothetical protein